MTSDVSDVVRALRERLATLQAAPDAGPATYPGSGRSAESAGGSADDHADGDPADGHRSAGHIRATGGPAGREAATADAPDPHEPAPAGLSGLSEEERAEEVQAKNICLRLLADSARPRAGLAQKLTQRGISAPVIERVLDRFTEVGLIDDQAYAEAYVRTKHQERALSRRALTAELRRKGLDDTVVATAAEAVDPDAEETAATRLVAKRAPAALAAGPDAARRRLLALLDRRGYPADLSIRVVESVLHPRDE
jgi:regulatory protein